MNDDKIKLGVLWKQLSRKGSKPYLSGRVQEDGLEAAMTLLRQGGRFLVLSNAKRPDKQDPDCVLFVVPGKQGDAAATSGPSRRTAEGGMKRSEATDKHR